MIVVKKVVLTGKEKESFFETARSCAELSAQGKQVVAVVSDGDTERLLLQAKEYHAEPSCREWDLLLASNGQMLAALLVMALESMGIPAISFHPFQLELQATEEQRMPEHLEIERVQKELQLGKIVVIAGEQGINEKRDYITLTGGADETAKMLATALQAEECVCQKEERNTEKVA